MTLDKQPDWIDEVCLDIDKKIMTMDNYWNEMFRNIIELHLPQTSYCSNTQEDTNQKTTVQNELLYETGYKEGYQKGREDMKKEIIEIYSKHTSQTDCNLLEELIYKYLPPTDTK